MFHLHDLHNKEEGEGQRGNNQQEGAFQVASSDNRKDFHMLHK